MNKTFWLIDEYSGQSVKTYNFGSLQEAIKSGPEIAAKNPGNLYNLKKFECPRFFNGYFWEYDDPEMVEDYLVTKDGIYDIESLQRISL